jgi:hypothetical protein
LLVPKIIIFYLSMRRRPQQPSPQEEQKGTARPSAFETNDPESQSLASATTRHETMMQTYQTPSNKKMNVATTFEVQSGGPDGEAKPFSLCPRNYKQRKQLGFAIFCAIVLSVWHVHSKGKTQNKQTNKQTEQPFEFLSKTPENCVPMNIRGVKWSVSFTVAPQFLEFPRWCANFLFRSPATVRKRSLRGSFSRL